MRRSEEPAPTSPRVRLCRDSARATGALRRRDGGYSEQRIDPMGYKIVEYAPESTDMWKPKIDQAGCRVEPAGRLTRVRHNRRISGVASGRLKVNGNRDQAIRWTSRSSAGRSW